MHKNHKAEYESDISSSEYLYCGEKSEFEEDKESEEAKNDRMELKDINNAPDGTDGLY